MSTVTELIATGAERMRLPFWNEHAYLAPQPEGPWADLWDVGAGVGSGEPVKVLIANCDLDDRWEATT